MYVNIVGVEVGAVNGVDIATDRGVSDHLTPKLHLGFRVGSSLEQQTVLSLSLVGVCVLGVAPSDSCRTPVSDVSILD